MTTRARPTTLAPSFEEMPRLPVATLLLVAVQLVVYLAMVVAGGDYWWFADEHLLAWGAHFEPLTVSEPWRAFTAPFLSEGVLPFIWSLIAIGWVGTLSERRLGPWAMPLIYVACGAGGTATSMLLAPGSAILSAGPWAAVAGLVMATTGWLIVAERKAAWATATIWLALILHVLAALAALAALSLNDDLPALRMLDLFGLAGGAVIGLLIGLAAGLVDKGRRGRRLIGVGAASLALFGGAVLVVPSTGQLLHDRVRAERAAAEQAQAKEMLNAMLFGTADECIRDDDCASNVCYYGGCVGALVVDPRWLQEQIGVRLADHVGRYPELREPAIARVQEVFARKNTDVAYRARALLALEWLQAKEALADALKVRDERIQAAAALSLTRLGDPRGLDLAAALSEHEQRSVAVEALRALGKSKRPEALVPLLRVLNPELDREYLVAGIEGLVDLQDPRGIRPLVALLERAPEYLHHRIVRGLRALTKAGLGKDPEAWTRWVREQRPPAAPEVELRRYESEEDFGIPSP